MSVAPPGQRGAYVSLLRARQASENVRPAEHFFVHCERHVCPPRILAAEGELRLDCDLESVAGEQILQAHYTPVLPLVDLALAHPPFRACRVRFVRIGPVLRHRDDGDVGDRRPVLALRARPPANEFRQQGVAAVHQHEIPRSEVAGGDLVEVAAKDGRIHIGYVDLGWADRFNRFHSLPPPVCALGRTPPVLG